MSVREREALKAYTEALAQDRKAYKEAIAPAVKAYKEAMARARKEAEGP